MFYTFLLINVFYKFVCVILKDKDNYKFHTMYKHSFSKGIGRSNHSYEKKITFSNVLIKESKLTSSEYITQHYVYNFNILFGYK